MSKEIDKLRAVLDMSWEDQVMWLCELGEEEPFLDCYVDEKTRYSVYTMNIHEDWWKPMARKMLADLAFRLRDEAVYLKKLEKRDSGNYDTEHRLYRNAMVKIYDYLNHTNIFYKQNPPQKYFIWWIETAQPIHFIIASLIAKQLAKEPK